MLRAVTVAVVKGRSHEGRADVEVGEEVRWNGVMLQGGRESSDWSLSLAGSFGGHSREEQYEWGGDGARERLLCNSTRESKEERQKRGDLSFVRQSVMERSQRMNLEC